MILSKMRFASRASMLTNFLWRFIPKGIYTFNFHRIGNKDDSSFDPNVFSCSVPQFENQLKFLKENFTIISTDELSHFLDSKKIDKRYAVITFDDGYIDNYTLAYPLLLKHNLPATIFVVTDYINQASLPWWDEVAWVIKNTPNIDLNKLNWSLGQVAGNESTSDKIKVVLKAIKQRKHESIEDKLTHIRNTYKQSIYINDLTDPLFASWDQLKEMASNNITIGSHTCSHKILSHLDENAQRDELIQSKAEIEKQIDIKVTSLAYPVGGASSFNQISERLAQETGYNLAFSYISGITTSANIQTRYQLRRIPIDNNASRSHLKRLIIKTLVFQR